MKKSFSPLMRAVVGVLAASLTTGVLPVYTSAATLMEHNPTLLSPEPGTYRYRSELLSMYTEIDEEVDPGYDLTVRWRNIADKFVVYTKLLYGDPNPSSANESGRLLEEYSYYGDNCLSENSFTLDADTLAECEGDYIKISIQGIDDWTGDYSWVVNHYLRVGESDEDYWSDDSGFGFPDFGWEEDTYYEQAAQPDEYAPETDVQKIVFKPGSSTVYVDGQRNVIPTKLIGQTAYVNATDFLFAIGCTSSSWINAWKQATYDMPGYTLTIYGDSYTAFRDSTTYTFANGTFIGDDGALYVSVRDLCGTLLGMEVDYHSTTGCCVVSDAYLDTAQMDQLVFGLGYSELTPAEPSVNLGSGSVFPSGADTRISDRLSAVERLLMTSLDTKDANYPYDVYMSYINGYGGMGLYSSIVIDTVMNLTDLFKGLDLQTSKAVRTLQMLLDEMDLSEQKDLLTAVNAFAAFFDREFFENADAWLGDFDDGLDLLADSVDLFDQYWQKQDEIESASVSLYLRLMETMPKLDDESLEVLLTLYNESTGKLIRLKDLRAGLDMVTGKLEMLGEAAEKLAYVPEKITALTSIIDVFADYTVELEKIALLRECGDPADTVLWDALSYCEAYYSDALVRLCEEINSNTVEFIEDGLGSAWAGVKLAFTYLPGGADRIAASCMALVNLQELDTSCRSEITRDIRYMQQTGGYGELEELKWKIHTLIDIRSLADTLARNLTSSASVKTRLQELTASFAAKESEIDAVFEEIRSILSYGR